MTVIVIGVLRETEDVGYNKIVYQTERDFLDERHSVR